jgi:hypothetical protein
VRLDDFEQLTGWGALGSEGVQLQIAQDTGHTGMGMRVDFDFREGPGFIVVRKLFSISLPDNYAFSFYLRGEAPLNNVEFKLVDPSGQNVWWYRKRNYRLPTEWRKVTVKKRQLEFAWGPAGGGGIKQVGALEFALSVGSGGKGTVWIDGLNFEPLEPPSPYELTPTVSASMSLPAHPPESVFDRDPASSWKSGSLAETQWLLIDFLKHREFGGLVVDWDPEDFATEYNVRVSNDGIEWTPAYSVTAGNGGRDYIPLPDAESRYLKLELVQSSRGQGYGIRAVTVKPYEFSASPDQMFEAIARDAPRGAYPKYFYGEQTYWTVVGTGGDDSLGCKGKQGLLNEEGMLEVDKSAFSIEPFLYVNGRLVTWNDVETTQELERGYLPIPSVIWRYECLNLRVTALAAGEPGAASLYARYRIENTTADPQPILLFLAIRPFQVNPPWQSLNMFGGTTLINDLDFDGHMVWVNEARAVVSLSTPERFGAATFAQGPLVDYLLEGRVPTRTTVSDPFGYASGALQYGLDLPPGGAQEVYLAIPFHDPKAAQITGELDQEPSTWWRQLFEEATRFWEAKLERVDIHLPTGLENITNTVKSTVAYILINRDGHALQPGPRCYARSWIRDGALTSTALLEMGYPEEVRNFIRWYTRYQSEQGKIPCCVDRRGPDPTPEHDSPGEFIYLVMEYYRYTRDVGLLNEVWPNVVKVVEYIDTLRQQRMTEAFKAEDQRPFYGLVPESISHEGYSSGPVHSYWDDFWVLRGLKDAASMAAVVGDEERRARFAKMRDDFRNDLYESISRTLARHKISYLPGSVELGDFDPTSTAIAVIPGGEQHNLPEAALTRTFDQYTEFFIQRQKGEVAWNSYTPYELRNVGALVRLGRRTFAFEVLSFFLKDRRPAAWNHWAEVVWRDPKTPRFIGDMPHTWVGSEYLCSLRSLFVFEREADQALVIGAGLPREWVENSTGVTVRCLPTYYGSLNYSLYSGEPGELRLSLSGDLIVPPGKIVLQPPLGGPLKTVTINGKDLNTFDAQSASITEFPAEVMLKY